MCVYPISFYGVFFLQRLIVRPTMATYRTNGLNVGGARQTTCCFPFEMSWLAVTVGY